MGNNTIADQIRRSGDECTAVRRAARARRGPPPRNITRVLRWLVARG